MYPSSSLVLGVCEKILSAQEGCSFITETTAEKILTLMALFGALSPNTGGCRWLVFNSHKTPPHIHLFMKKYLLNIFYVPEALDTEIKLSWSLSWRGYSRVGEMVIK